MLYQKIKKEIKSPLRYPGGKTRAIPQILPLIPPFKEYREPFIGGGSIFFALKQRVMKNIIFKINDLNYDLYCFWKIAKDNNKELVKAVQKVKDEEKDGKELYKFYRENHGDNDFERAVRFFVLNRITFSGLADSGGYSAQAFKRRFTQSSIDRLALVDSVLKDTIITGKDYEEIVLEEGNKVFIFLDPPYWKATKKKLYGKDGDLHLTFDHERFARVMKKCNHKWLITYDDCEKIRELFSFANIYEWELQYGMNNYKQKEASKGKELFISNFKLNNYGKKLKETSILDFS
ncbi:MAG: DNA adenine methylase [Promethearchaeota archaeon]